MRKFLLLTVLFYAQFSTAQQCTIEITPPTNAIDCGDCFTLTAVGSSFTVPLDASFNGGALGPGWSSNVNIMYDNPCGPPPDGTAAAWFGLGSQPREMETVGFDVSCGGDVCFEMKYATQGGAAGAGNCEGPNEANEGVFFQYSINGGATWVTIEYWSPNGGFDPILTQWNTYCVTIPTFAETTNTKFRWFQNVGSGALYDHWGIDNVNISAINCTFYYYDWLSDGIANSADTTFCMATSPQNYEVTYTNGVNDTCTAIITISDGVAPTGTAPAAITVQCIGGVPIPNIATITDEADNCTAIPTVTHVGDVSDGNTCPEIITRTYNIADDTGNSIDVTQTITIIDDIDPTGTAPPMTVQCIGDLPLPDVTVITDEADNCTANPIVTYVGEVSDGNTCPEIITRTYNIADDCGNNIDVTQIISIIDDTAPTGTAPPITVQCIGDVPLPDVTVITDEADNCTLTPTVTYVGDLSDGNTCPEIITRTYNIADECGNSTDVAQTITIIDDINPTGTAPAAMAFQCLGDIPAADITLITDEADNCITIPTVTYVGDASDGNTCPEVITRTYRITDVCGNYTDITQAFTINDDILPTGTAPLDFAFQCVTDIPVPDITLITDEADNCTVNPIVTHVSDVSDGNTCPETITRTYNIADDCGNNIDVTQAFTINDDIDPIGSITNLVVQCIGDVPLPDITTITDEADNCAVNPTITHLGDVSDGNSCPEIITRTYNIEDNCGNNIDVVQTITIIDDIAPTASNPTALAVQCIGDVPIADVLVVTDEADNCTINPTVTYVGDASDGNTCPEIITRTYNIADNCGNNIDVFQTITILDDIAPTGSTSSLAVQCIGDVPVPDITTITNIADNCTVNPIVTHVVDVSDGNTCPEVITRTYNIADNCGNNININQTITINDDTDPAASNPNPITVQCLTDVPLVDISVVTDEADNCTVNPTVAFVSESTDANTCNGEIITRIYSVTDDCGNSISVSQAIIVDSYTPIFTVSGNGPTFCNGNDGVITLSGLVPFEDYVLNYDGGATNPITANAAGEYLITGLSAGTYTGFTVSDGNCQACTTTNNISLNLNDPASALIDAGPDQELCEGTTLVLTAFNPDGANISWNNGVTDGVGFVPPVGISFYTVTAERANCFSSDEVMITVSPAITGMTAPADLTATCGISQQPVYADFDAFVLAGGSATIPTGGEIDSTSFSLFSEISDGNTCPEIITRTYQIADTCGVTVSSTQTITINDLILPTGTAPADLAVQCIGDVPVPDITAITDEADNCTTNPIITHVSDVSDGNTCPEVITRTYNIADACGNNINVIQTITINDDTNPTGTAPMDLAVQCIGDVPLPNVLEITDEADNCTVNPTVTHVSDVSNGNTCPEVITRTYNIADDCGNNINVVQTITINDDTDPTGTAAPIAVQCIGDVPLPDITVVLDEADNCTANPTVNFVSDVSDGNTCPEIITRTYNVADDCGNDVNITQIITINDDINPTGTAPADLAVQCIGDVPAADIALITDEADNCTAVPTVTFVSDVSDGNTCPEVITRTYNIADDCGNNIDVTQTITINDDIAPTGSAAPVLVQCIGDVPASDIAYITDEADNCTTNPIVTFVSDVSDGNTCPEVITRTYNIADDCGNNTDITQTITINDDTNPTGTAPNDTLVQCIGDVPIVDVTKITDETDNCTANPTVTHVSDISDGNTCPEVITRTYNIADDCGNDIDVIQTITINDDVLPTASNPDSITVACLADVPLQSIAVVTDEADNCTVNPTVTFVSETSDGNTCNSEELTRIYSVTDDCGNTINVTQIITIDLIAPTFTVSSTNPTTCDGNEGTITLSGLAPSTNFELNYDGGAVISITTDAAGEYTITGLVQGTYTDFTISELLCSTCSTTENVTMTLTDPIPPVVNAGTDITACENDIITLTAFNPESANISWNNGVVDGVGFVSPVGISTYTVTAERVNCFTTDQVQVTINPLPIVDAGIDYTVCDGDQTTLSGSGADNYVWDNGVVDNVPFTPSLGLLTYTVVGTSVFGCVNTDQVDVEVIISPDISFTANRTIGCAPQEINLFSTSPGIGNQCVYTINGGQQISGCNVNPIFTEAGCFDVNLQVELTNGCTDNLTVTDYICIDDYPIADFTVNPEELTNIYNIADFTNETIGATDYEWNFGDGDFSNSINPTHEYSVDEINRKFIFDVELVATSNLGCKDTFNLDLPFFEELIYFIPNTFTPDGNQYNESFKPQFTSGFEPLEYKLQIYNRWGELIFESNNPAYGWDGSYGSSQTIYAPEGTYLYKIYYKKIRDGENVEIVGSVNLLR
ncbi:T9SS type B sorting domain-containing protein [Brumimicrobium glaciale]|uniref:T9SS type B sorting domain-containing protein n=1 Tax=Brumimicrobium glaciale TaxID=200475 RepID=A0A4Q4KJK1_9FLAO|nr:gliding motility-associated C-terminal domain-containing protein [Brumimicrobium glaciale]RYM33513.1 T9SS type B sorting domain-containing protein [Brumimicrobium glaciale]